MNTDTVQMIGFMNQNELFEYIQFMKNIFKETCITIVDRESYLYDIEISESCWITCPDWASSVTVIEDLSSIKYPVYTV